MILPLLIVGVFLLIFYFMALYSYVKDGWMMSEKEQLKDFAIIMSILCISSLIIYLGITI